MFRAFQPATALLRDWPRQLRINAAAFPLAHALHKARSEAFSLPFVPWEDLPRALREALLRECCTFLKHTERMSAIMERQS